MDARRVEVRLSQNKINLIKGTYQKRVRLLERGSLRKGFRSE